MKLLTLVIAPLLSTIISCNSAMGPDRKLTGADTTTVQPRQELPDITGKWLWVKTDCCGRMHQIITDTSTTPTYLVLEEDGKLKRLHGDKTLKVATYTYTMDPNMGYPVLSISGINYNALIHFVGDTMLVDYGYMDLQSEYYIPAK